MILLTNNIKIRLQGLKRRFDNKPLHWVNAIFNEVKKEFSQTPKTNEFKRKELKETIHAYKIYIKQR